MQRRCAIIAGSSGLVGGFCLNALLADPAFSRVTALVRRPLPKAHDKLRQQVADFDNLSQLEDLSEGVVFCALGTTIRKAGSQAAFRHVDFDYPLRLAELARKAGATSFVLVSSVDAAPKSSTFYLRVKGELEERIGALGYPALHIFRPSVLLGDRDEQRTGEKVGIAIAKVLQFLLIDGLSRYRPIEAADVGRAMPRAVAREKPGRHIYHWKDITGILAD